MWLANQIILNSQQTFQEKIKHFYVYSVGLEKPIVGKEREKMKRSKHFWFAPKMKD